MLSYCYSVTGSQCGLSIAIEYVISQNSVALGTNYVKAVEAKPILRGVFTTRRYTNRRLPCLTLPYHTVSDCNVGERI